jgi:hypothetical protein
MAKNLIKIAVALIVIHGAFRVGTAYWNFYRFEDALQQAAQFGERRSDKQLCDEAMEAAGNYGVPIPPSGLTIFRGNNPPYTCDGGPTAAPSGAPTQPAGQIRIEGAYTDRLQVLPGYFYPWEFKPAVKAWIRL